MEMDELEVSLSPRFRFSNSFLVVLEVEQEFKRNDIGYVSKSDDNTQIFMGLRDVSTFTSTLNGLYTFNANSFLNIRLRHYWRWLDYSSYHTLNSDGNLSPRVENSGFNKNINYNLFNIDLTYEWHFAPGSVLSVVWKNVIETSNSHIRSQYFENVDELWNTGKGNSISLRMLYYLDYNTLFGGRKK
jgi:hypothetical protein